MKRRSSFQWLFFFASFLWASLSASAQLNNGLLNYWDFQGDAEDSASDFANNASTTEDDGTLDGSTTFGLGPKGFGQAASFPGGRGNHITVPDSPASSDADLADDIDRTDSDLSISIWLKFGGDSVNWQGLVSHGEGSDYRIARQAGNDQAAYNGGGNNNDVTGTGTINEGWHHLVATTEHGVEAKLYLDGQLIGTRLDGEGGKPIEINDNGGDSLIIGGKRNSDLGWSGLLDDIAMWDRPLSAAEVLQIYQAGITNKPLSQLLNTADADMDNLPDAWENTYGISTASGAGDNGPTGNLDSDSLNNLAEFNNGTNPLVADTDGDFSDDDEEDSNSTDPLDSDSDDDGLLDGYENNDGSFFSEIQTGSDPNKPDTDMDSFSDGLEVALGTDPNSAASAPATGVLPIIDDFEDGFLNNAFWMTDLNAPQGFAEVTEDNGKINFAGRGYLITVGEFDPEVLGAISITGEFSFGSPSDIVSILTRSDATPIGGFGNAQSGIEFVINTDGDQIAIGVRSGEHQVDDPVRTGRLTFQTDTPYLFAILDDGAGNLTMNVEEKGSPENFASVRTFLSVDNSDRNHIAIYNRERVTDISCLEEISIVILPDSDGDGMDDDWERDNGLVVGINDAGEDPDDDDVFNIDEYLDQTNPQNDDTDFDFSKDGEEKINRTNPRKQDTDDDGIIDSYETNEGPNSFVSATDTGSDPTKADTDKDGTNDGLEVAIGRDPTDPNDAPTGLAKGLVSYWNFDGTLNDIAATGMISSESLVADDGTFTGPDTDVFFAASGLFGSSALQLTGENGWVTVPSSADTLRNVENSLTVSAWFQVGAFDTGWQALIVHGESSQYRITRQASTDTLNFAGGAVDINNGPDVSDGEWHHVVAVSEDAVSTRLYIDGTLVNTSGAPNLTDIGDTGQPIPDLFFGANPQRSNRTWEGLIDDIGLWNRALTEAEIAEIYDGGTGKSIESLLPAVPTSLSITSFTYDPAGDGGNGTATFTWPAVAGRTYGLFYSTDLTSDSWGADVNDSILAGPNTGDPLATFANGVMTYGPVPNPSPGAAKLFFRVETQ